MRRSLRAHKRIANCNHVSRAPLVSCQRRRRTTNHDDDEDDLQIDKTFYLFLGAVSFVPLFVLQTQCGVHINHTTSQTGRGAHPEAGRWCAELQRQLVARSCFVRVGANGSALCAATARQWPPVRPISRPADCRSQRSVRCHQNSRTSPTVAKRFASLRRGDRRRR